MALSLPNKGYPGLLDTGVRVLRTPDIPAPNNAMGEALGDAANKLAALQRTMVEAQDTRQLIEAEDAMGQAMARQMKFQQDNVNESDWLPQWEQEVTNLKTQFGELKLTDGARLNLTRTLNRFSSNQGLEIQGAAFKQAVNRTNTAAMNQAIAAADVGDDDGVDRALSKIPPNFMFPEQVERERMRLKEAAKNKRWEIASNNAKTIIGNGGSIEDALSVIDATDAPDDIKELTKVGVRQLHERTVETKANKADAEYYGSILNRLADGTPKAELLADVEKRIQSGQVSGRSLDTFARLKSSLKGDIGATPDQLEELINSEVLPYNPEQDPTFKKAAEIQQKALELGLNPLQAQRFNALMANADERHKTPESRVAASLHLEARKLLADFGDKSALTADKDPTVLQTLQKAYALEHWGIDSVTADKIRKLTKTSPSEAIALFRETSNARKPLTKNAVGQVVDDKGLKYEDGGVKYSASVINPDEIAQLAPADIQAFERAVANKSFITTDEGEQREAAMIKAQLQGELDDWAESFRKQEKRNPTKDDYLNKMRSLTEPYEDSELWKPTLPDIQMPRKTNARSPEPNRYTVEPDGSFSGLASSYGYEGDADNGYNSVGFKRGEQPWYGEAPTIALAPSVAENLGVSLPRRTKDGWDLSNSYVEIEANGQKTRAIYDENGMYIVAASKNKLVDLTPEASAALGLPIKSNHPVKVRKDNRGQAKNSGASSVLGYELREPFPGEVDFFRKNPHVAGMAAEDGKITLNPHSKLSDAEKQSVAINEAVRLYLRENEHTLSFEVTDEQRKAFEGTAYGADEKALRETIVARIISGDASAKATDEQKKIANSIRKEMQSRA
jgi:hypothetical protein